MSQNPAIVFPRPAARVAVGPVIDNACITPQERMFAQEACSNSQLRGLGEDVYYGELEESYGPYDNTRWRDIPPCQVADLPLCDCANDWDTLALTPCLAGTAGPAGWSQQFFDNWCAQRGAGLLDTDYCPGNTVPAAPSCLEDDARAGLNYCATYGYAGPNAYANALCWNAIQSGLLSRMMNLPGCSASPSPSPAPQPQPPFVPPPAPPVTAPPSSPETRRSSMMLPGLILLLVVGGGTAYYVSQRKRKR